MKTEHDDDEPLFKWAEAAAASDTAIAGLQSVDDVKATKRRDVYRAIMQCGSATDETIADKVGQDIRAVAARRIELMRDGLVKDSGLRAPGRRGSRMHTLWTIGAADDFERIAAYKELVHRARRILAGADHAEFAARLGALLDDAPV